MVNRRNTFHRAVQGLIGATVLYYTINTILFVTEVSNLVYCRIGDKACEDEKMLIAESVPLYKSCGNQTCLGTAPADTPWELHLL